LLAFAFMSARMPSQTPCAEKLSQAT